MHFDPNTLNMLLTESDETLWQTIRKIAAMNQIELPYGTPSTGEMKKLRQLLSGIGEKDPREAQAIIDEYRKKGGGK